MASGFAPERKIAEHLRVVAHDFQDVARGQLGDGARRHQDGHRTAQSQDYEPSRGGDIHALRTIGFIPGTTSL